MAALTYVSRCASSFPLETFTVTGAASSVAEDWRKRVSVIGDADVKFRNIMFMRGLEFKQFNFIHGCLLSVVYASAPDRGSLRLEF